MLKQVQHDMSVSFDMSVQGDIPSVHGDSVSYLWIAALAEASRKEEYFERL